MGCGRTMTESDLKQLGVTRQEVSTKQGVQRAVEKAWTKESAKQEMWRRMADDPKQNSDIRGWVKQEINRLEQIARAKEAGRKPPGGSPDRIRAHPSYDAGHRIPGIHRPENLRPELISMNRARPGIARRMGITKYR